MNFWKEFLMNLLLVALFAFSAVFAPAIGLATFIYALTSSFIIAYFVAIGIVCIVDALIITFVLN